MTDAELGKTIRSLFAAEKPEGLNDLDLLQTLRLISQSADEQDVFAGQDTLAEELLTSVDSIKRSQDRLVKVGWISIRKRGRLGKTLRYVVHLDKLPVGDLTKTVITKPAEMIAARYGLALKVDKKRRFMKGWEQQWAFQIQKFIKRSGGDANLVVHAINFALTSPKYQAKAKKGPFELRRVWKRILDDYKETVKANVAAVPATTHTVQAPANGTSAADLYLWLQIVQGVFRVHAANCYQWLQTVAAVHRLFIEKAGSGAVHVSPKNQQPWMQELERVQRYRQEQERQRQELLNGLR